MQIIVVVGSIFKKQFYPSSSDLSVSHTQILTVLHLRLTKNSILAIAFRLSLIVVRLFMDISSALLKMHVLNRIRIIFQAINFSIRNVMHFYIRIFNSKKVLANKNSPV